MMRLMLAVNNRHGNFTGLLPQISLWDSEQLTLESPWADRHLRCEIQFTPDRCFRLGMTEWWRFQGHTPHVGSIVWDELTVTPVVAADVLNFCLHKDYRPTVGDVRLWEKIDAGLELTAADLMETA